MKFQTIKHGLLTICILLITFSTSFAQEADDLLGVWLTGEGKAHVKITKSDGKYYGTIIWLKDPLNDEGKPKVDKNNPDKSKRTNPIIGLAILKDFEFDGDDMWEDGTIYDPDNGKTYSCQMEMEDGKLEVTGYIGFSWIGRTTTWTRVE